MIETGQNVEFLRIKKTTRHRMCKSNCIGGPRLLPTANDDTGRPRAWQLPVKSVAHRSVIVLSTSESNPQLLGMLAERSPSVHHPFWGCQLIGKRHGDLVWLASDSRKSKHTTENSFSRSTKVCCSIFLKIFFRQLSTPHGNWQLLNSLFKMENRAAHFSSSRNSI